VAHAGSFECLLSALLCWLAGHLSPHRVTGLQEAGQRLVRSAHPLFALFARLPQQHNILVKPGTDGMMMLVSFCCTIAVVLTGRSLLNTVQQASVCFVKVTTNTAGWMLGSTSLACSLSGQ